MQYNLTKDFIWQDYSLNTLKKLSSPYREFYINQYDSYIEELKKNRFNRELIEKNYGLSVSKLEEICYYNLEKHMDEDGIIMAFYPVIKEVRSSKNRICYFSGAMIRKGSFYLCYRPFLENIMTHTTYVLQKPIHVELGYFDELPKNYRDFSYMDKQLQNGFYYDFSTNYGNDCLKLQKIGKKR